MRGVNERSSSRGGIRPSWGFRRERFVAQGLVRKPENRASNRMLSGSFGMTDRITNKPEAVQTVGTRAWNGYRGMSERQQTEPARVPETEHEQIRQRRLTFAEVVASGSNNQAVFKDMVLPPRQVQQKNGKPFILFSEDEIQPAYKDMANAVIIKFRETRPKIETVKEVINHRWNLKKSPFVGALDGKHLLVICSSEEDAVEVLTNDSNRIGNLSFRTFYWKPGFTVKAEPTSMVTWTKISGLDSCLYRPGILREVCRGFGKFLKVDQHTINLTNPGMARVCVEVDVTKPLISGMWVGTENRQQWIHIEYERQMTYCFRCKKQGHSTEFCKRKIARNRKILEETEHRYAIRKKTQSKERQVLNYEDRSKMKIEKNQWQVQKRKNWKQDNSIAWKEKLRRDADHTFSRAEVERKQNTAQLSMETEHQMTKTETEHSATEQRRKAELRTEHNATAHRGTGSHETEQSNAGKKTDDRTADEQPTIEPRLTDRRLASRGDEMAEVNQGQVVLRLLPRQTNPAGCSEDNHHSKSPVKVISPPSGTQDQSARQEDQTPAALGSTIAQTPARKEGLYETTRKEATPKLNLRWLQPASYLEEQYSLVPAAKEKVMSGSIRMAIESSFMKRIRSSIEDYVYQLYGRDQPDIPPTAYRRMISIDDSSLTLSLPPERNWEELPLTIVSPEEDIIEESNQNIAERVASLKKARDLTRRVTRSATKSTPEITYHE